MKKLLSILAAVGLSATMGATVVACGPKTPEEKGDFSIKLTDDTKMVVNGKGKIQISDYENLKETYSEFVLDIPTIGEGRGIISSVGKFDEKDGTFEIKGLTVGKVKVKVYAKAKNEEGKLEEKVSGALEIDVKASENKLSDLIKKTDLGELKDDSEMTIIQAVLDANPNPAVPIGLDNLKIKDDSKTPTSAIITGRNPGEFADEVKVKFELPVLPNIEDVLNMEDLDLGHLDLILNDESQDDIDHDTKMIFDAVIAKNSKAEGIIAVDEKSLKATSADIIPLDSRTHTGRVTVTFTTDK